MPSDLCLIVAIGNSTSAVLRSIGGSGMQRALLGAAIALILVLVTALVGPLFVDW
jgi:hypothetical protein